MLMDIVMIMGVVTLVDVLMLIDVVMIMDVVTLVDVLMLMDVVLFFREKWSIFIDMFSHIHHEIGIFC